ncbi:MAG: UDP-glucose 4-epimerase [Flavobacterium sp.]|jgi:UDP-glucose 4-epimerase
MLNIAIVGSNGFIGKHLVKELKTRKEVKIYQFNRRINSKSINSDSEFEIDLINKNKINQQFKNIDIVYYLASSTIPSSSWENPLIELQNNLIPFITFNECIAKLAVKKIVFVSSAGTVYGASKSKVLEKSNKEPFSPYGIVKLSMEHFLNYFKTKYNLQYDIFRISNVYGEDQNTSKGLGIINTFIENILLKQEINIFGDGQNLRNYIYVKDVAKILSLTLDNDFYKSEIYNLSTTDTLSINQLAQVIKDHLKIDFNIVYTKNRNSDNSFIDLDNSKLVEEFSNFKFTSLRDGIFQTYNHLKKTP